jgi:hypothetical protein
LFFRTNGGQPVRKQKVGYIGVETIMKLLGSKYLLFMALTAQAAEDQMIQVVIANKYAVLSNVLEQQGIDPRDSSVLGVRI